MELKLMIAWAASKLISCSNRTFMELKYQKESSDYEAYQVLIAPLWN